jgi:hypothetical protein
LATADGKVSGAYAVKAVAFDNKMENLAKQPNLTFKVKVMSGDQVLLISAQQGELDHVNRLIAGGANVSVKRSEDIKREMQIERNNL